MNRHRQKRNGKLGAKASAEGGLSLLEAIVRSRAAKAGLPQPKTSTAPLVATVRPPYRPSEAKVRRIERAVEKVRSSQLG